MIYLLLPMLNSGSLYNTGHIKHVCKVQSDLRCKLKVMELWP